MSDREFKEGPADPLEGYLRNLTRRRFFGSMAGGVLGGLGATGETQSTILGRAWRTSRARSTTTCSACRATRTRGARRDMRRLVPRERAWRAAPLRYKCLATV